MRKVLAHVSIAALALSAAAAGARAQESATGIFVTFTDPADEGMAERVRDVAARMKTFADQLENVERVEIHLVHSPRELALRAGGETSARVVPSYVHSGFFLLSPLAWPGNPTQEAIEHEVQQGLVLYAIHYLAGGNRLPAWLEEGLLAHLTRQEFPAPTAGLVAQRAGLLLARFEPPEPAVGYWAVKYLVELRGGLGAIRQLLRLVAQRPDLFVDNLQLVYGTSVGELERAWRAWCQELAEQEEQRQKGGIQVGPLRREPPPPKP
ncbi:MAG: hypothetical protein HY653_02535 [Acidobacteria bacterium]|nr:hypothetical protein [Acidobacteriota bacterium]